MITQKYSVFIRHIIIIAFAYLMIYPLLWMFSSSFKLPHNIFIDAGLWSEAFTINNYMEGWKGLSGASFGIFFRNSFFLAAMAIIGNILTCSMAAYAFARMNFRMKSILFGLMLLTMMLPHHVTTIPQYIIFNNLGWVNTYLPLIIPKFTATEGFYIFLMIQFMRNIPSELDQAATVDGCGQIQIYWRVILPLTLPAIVTTAIFTFIGTWNDFFSNILYLNDIKKYTVSLGLRMFMDSEGESQWGRLFAMSTLSLVPVFAIFIFFQKYLIEGIAAGGVKG